MLPHATALVFVLEVRRGARVRRPWEVGYRLKQAIAKAGLAVDGRSFHSFRHSYAARALEARASIFWLSRQLGHSSTQVTTEKYGHSEKRARRAETDKLAGALVPCNGLNGLTRFAGTGKAGRGTDLRTALPLPHDYLALRRAGESPRFGHRGVTGRPVVRWFGL